MVGKIIGGWMVITSSYFLTLYAMFTLYWIIFKEPVDHNWNISGAFIGAPLLIIPYLVAGLYTKKVFDKKRTGALWVSIIPVISERLLIYLIGYLLVLGGGDGSMDGVTTMMFIRGEAAPYYTYTYIICGIISVLICVIAASNKPKKHF
ncbi:hypothetical protein RAC89_28485 [Paenibacillus sp. GD4]|uniref:hypothetical protein n=1 Tax=Paenibacillus sp. GD4 TaxID=3068890 RepID=UPI0027968158|nr:hypothetical protein [Paenibacillus sp. GD4]MDQ1914321.1 hypothetical protein [Paenibacillus sp. GD4]